MLAPPNFMVWKACACILHLIAMASTLFRLVYRHQMRRIWWDDYATIPALIADALLLITMFLRVYDKDPGHVDLRGKIALHWVASAAFLVIIWWTRISLGLAIVRILPAWDRLYKISLSFVVSFMMCFIAWIPLMMDRCLKDTSWHRSTSTVIGCGNKTAGIVRTCTELYADVVIFVLPVYRLRSIRLHRNERTLVLSLFSASLVTLIMTSVYAIMTYTRIFTGKTRVARVIMVGQMEAAVSMIVCNILVVVSFVYRVCRRHPRDIEYEIESTQHRNVSNAIGPSSASPRNDAPTNPIVLTEITDPLSSEQIDSLQTKNMISVAESSLPPSNVSGASSLETPSTPSNIR